MLKVFGHLNPDTDSVSAAIVYAWLLNEQGQEATSYILSKPNKEALYVLERFGFKKPESLQFLVEGDEVVLVDTNNPAELPDGMAFVTIKEIVDHHKLVGGFATAEPPIITIRPVACTMTVIWHRMQELGVVDIPEDIACLMLAAIVSDTLKFTSPTTTQEDKDLAKKLAEIAKVDVEELAAEMFAAKSDLTGMSARDLLLSDSKVFDMGLKKIRISSLETTDTLPALKMEAEIIADAEVLKQEEGLDGLFFFIVDILNSSATLLLVSDFEKEAAQKAFGAITEGNRMVLPGVVSRKKQMVPPLEKALS